jgi:hypothetical protein
MINELPNNLIRCGSVFISTPNMCKFAENLVHVDDVKGILITPYLINKGKEISELLYYEFDIDVRGSESYLADYNKNNTLPAEIIQNIKPQAIVAVGDTTYYRESVSLYLEKMRQFKFENVKEQYPKLKDAEVYYQIFTDVAEDA